MLLNSLNKNTMFKSMEIASLQSKCSKNLLTFGPLKPSKSAWQPPFKIAHLDFYIGPL